MQFRKHMETGVQMKGDKLYCELCGTGKAKHSCKEQGISQPVFFSLTSSSVGNVYKLKSNLVRILLRLQLLPDIALNISQQWVQCLKEGGLFFFPWGLKKDMKRI